MKSRVWKRIVSVILMMALLVGCLNGTGFCVVSAKKAYVSVDQPWVIPFQGQNSAPATLHIEQSGLYKIRAVSDTGIIKEMYVKDANGDKCIVHDDDAYYQYLNNYYYLAAGVDYTLVVVAILNEGNRNTGTVTVTVQKCEVGTIGTVSNRDISAELKSHGDWYWAQFTTAQAGDYRLRFANAGSRRVSVIEESSGEHIFYGYMFYTMGEYVPSIDQQAKVLTLKENTNYILRVGSKSQPIYLEKCEKDIRTIRIHEYVKGNQIIDRNVESESGFATAWFDYRVCYTDGTEEIMTYTDIGDRGILMPFVQTAGRVLELPDTSRYYTGGTQPFILNYRGDYSVGYARFDAVHTRGGVWPREEMEIYKGTNESKMFVLAPKSTGIYRFLTNNLAAFEELELIVLDQYYNPVYYNEEKGGYPLLGGRGYDLYVDYSSNAYAELFYDKKGGTLFPDTHPDAWYYDAVIYATGRGVISGYKNGNFGTSDLIQRQDFLVMLARYAGIDLDAYKDVELPFPDVVENSYYKAAVAWGYENGIVTGYNSGRFGVGDAVTREQIATFLYRYAYWSLFDVTVSEKEYQAVVDKYKDCSRVSEFAEQAVVWAIDRGVITGKNGSKIAPHGKAQRCEVAQMLYNAFIKDVF